MLTASSFDRLELQPELVGGAAPALEIGPSDRSFHVAPARIALGAIPASFREWRAQPAPGRRPMRLPALLGAVALHIAGLALILLVEWSLVAPEALPAITVSLNFEPAPQPAASAPRESVAELAPVEAAVSPPDASPPIPEPPAASEEPPPPPVAMAPPEPPVAPPAETAPVPTEPAPVVEAPPPKPPAVVKTRTKAPPTPISIACRRRHRALPKPRSPLRNPRRPLRPAAPAASPPALVAAAPIVPPRPVDFAHGNRKPDYPVMARSRGQQGLVLLRVDVAPSGTPIAVTVATSSGHPILDDAAVAAVRTWRFSPATQAGVPVAAFADVPIQFRMAE